jgi:hypothetical protein
MKSKQLANVLIKTIGLYICLCAIPDLFLGLGAVLAAAGVLKWNDTMVYESSQGIGAVVQLVVGIILISKSRKLAEFWFKAEDE